MRKYLKCLLCSAAFVILFLAVEGCSVEKDNAVDGKLEAIYATDSQLPEPMLQITEMLTEEASDTDSEPVITEVDWSGYFEGINGTAVIYDPAENCYQIYNQELALNRHSPCSTFKIISSLIALENGVIEPDSSTRPWSGEVFWNEDWNRDVDFPYAFRTSCVWYFREVIDDIGADKIQEELDRLQYGNCDISDWEGRMNTNNSNPATTGFWIESSLAISPKEQVEVMERIFDEDADYSQATQNQLKQVMLVSDSDESPAKIYGKTGMGRSNGAIDAWFAGFADTDGKRLYFCVYLGGAEGENISSSIAKEIALEIISDY